MEKDKNKKQTQKEKQEIINQAAKQLADIIWQYIEYKNKLKSKRF